MKKSINGRTVWKYGTLKTIGLYTVKKIKRKGEDEETCIRREVSQGYGMSPAIFNIYSIGSVSYTHLDVYKRQSLYSSSLGL